MAPTNPVTRLAFWLAVRLAAVPLLLGCSTPPHLGTDEGRKALVWQNRALVRDTEAAPTISSAANAEHELLGELRDAEVKGRSDLATAGALYDLAMLRRQQGALDEAEGLYRRALAIHEREQGPAHPDVARVLNNLAALLAARGNYDEARPLFERALSIRQSALGPEHELAVQSLNNLALLCAAEGNAAEAERLYRRALAVLEKSDAGKGGATSDGDLVRVLENYAALLEDTGRDAEAQELEARARAIRAVDGALPAAER
jgi:tetratricopeptide (TPR) repeat protein